MKKIHKIQISIKESNKTIILYLEVVLRTYITRKAPQITGVSAYEIVYKLLLSNVIKLQTCADISTD